MASFTGGLDMADPEAVRRAHAEGVEFGRDLRNQAGSCPYLHDRLDLRLAWMDGFGTKRPYRIEQGPPPPPSKVWTAGGV